MNRPRASVLVVAVVLSLVAACSKEPSIDWSAKENFFAVEKSKETSDSAVLEFQSLINAPAAGVYQALATPEDYASFVDGVSRSKLLSTHDNTKITEITQTVVGQQTRAKVEWTLDPKQMRITFHTLQSDASYNDGSYWVIPSPDGKRCYVISVYHVREKGPTLKVPIGVLEGGTRDAYERAARSIKAHVLGLR